MKRIGILLITFMSALCTNAQIRDTFFGFNLGVATKAQVLSGLKSQWEICKYDSENKSYYVENVTFASTEWDFCVLEFYKDTLYFVGFALTSADKGNVDELYKKNLQNTKIKYDNIKESVVSNEKNYKQSKFDDGNIVMSVCYKQLENMKYNTSVIYQDRKLILQIKEDSLNDL